MALPRDRTVPPNTNGYYHCISRCVRRAWLCGYDKVNDIDYGYRRKWVEERILLLAEAFAVSIYAYAVMSNHLHVVLKVDASAAKDWSDEEVARRWCVGPPCRTSLDSHFSDFSEPNLRNFPMRGALQAATMTPPPAMDGSLYGPTPRSNRSAEH
ncbi:transposase [Ahniella affigens]|nr:transposase [Ahniella affigens]